MALGEMYGGTYQLLAAQEISSADHSAKLRELLPGPAADWSASFTDSTSTMDNGYWFRDGVTVTADDIIRQARIECRHQHKYHAP
jgi:hypothetical protein